MSTNINNQTSPLQNTKEQVSLEKSQRAQQSYNTLKTTEATQQNISEEERRTNTYDGLMSAATQAQQKYEDAIKMYNKRVERSPYSKKNIKLSDGTLGYVNNLGYFQKYDNIDQTAGINNCPSKSNIINSGLSPIDIGNPLVLNPASASKNVNTTCGYEGNNLYVDAMLENINATSHGCYTNTGSMSLLKLDKNDKDASMTYQECKYMAAQLGKSVFGLQAYDKNTGFSRCLVGDNYASAISGEKKDIVMRSKVIWKSKDYWSHAGESQDDYILWKPLKIGCCKGSTITVESPEPGYVVGNIPINKQHGYPNGRYFGGSGWPDTFHVTQTGPTRTGGMPDDVSMRKHLSITTQYGTNSIPSGPGYSVNPWYMGGISGTSRPLSAFNVIRARYYFPNPSDWRDKSRGVDVTGRVRWLMKHLNSFPINDKMLLVNMPYPDARNVNGKVIVRRTDHNSSWGQQLVLPMFPTKNGNAERGIEYMKTDEGIRKLRQQMINLNVSSNTVEVFQHCNYGGWKVSIPVGTDISNTHAVPGGLIGYGKNSYVGISGISSMKIPAGVSVRVYTNSAFSGMSSLFEGPTSIPCLVYHYQPARSYYQQPWPYSWNDRINSLRVFGKNQNSSEVPLTGPNNTYKTNVSSSNWNTATSNAPIKSMVISKSGNILFFSEKTDYPAELPKDKLVMKVNIPNSRRCTTEKCTYVVLLIGLKGQDQLYDKWKDTGVVTGLNFIKLMNTEPREAYYRHDPKPGSFVYYKLELTTEQKTILQSSPSSRKKYIDSIGPMLGGGNEEYMQLNEGQFMSTPDGRLTAKLSDDGTGLELSVVEVDRSLCFADQHGNKTTKDQSSVAVYSMDSVGDTRAFGKMGYIDYNGKMHEYDENDIVVDNQFENEQKQRDIVGYDLPGMPIANIATIDDAKKECLKNDKAFGFVYVPSKKLLYLKDRTSTTKAPSLTRNTILVRRQVKVNPEKFNKGCQDKNNILKISSTIWQNTPQSNNNMDPKFCDRNRFLNEPAMVELRRDWEEKRKKATEFGGSVQNASSSMLRNRQKQQQEVLKNNKENKLNDNIYNTTMNVKIPNADNHTSGKLKTIPDSFEGFTPLAAERNFQSELETPEQRQESTTFRNINGIVEDTKLLVDEDYLKMGVWSVAAMVTGLISAKLLMRGNN